MRRWPFSVRIAAAFLVGAALHAVGWWWLSDQVRAGFEAWANGQRALGRTVSGGPVSLSGYPFAGGISVPDVAVADPTGRWTAERLLLTVVPWAPHLLRVNLSGHQTLAAGLWTAGLDARSMRWTVVLPAGDSPVLSAAGVNVDLPAGRVTADHVEGSLRFEDGATRLSASVHSVQLPPGPAYLLGPALAEAGLDASMNGPAPQPNTADLAAWRDAGGTVRLDEVRLRWGALSADATGTMALDRALQPLADLRVSLTGAQTALDSATAQGLIQPRTATAVRTVLALLSRANPVTGGQPGAIPASLRDGTVAVAGFPIARLPPVAWP